jgi:hypothetical protein
MCAFSLLRVNICNFEIKLLTPNEKIPDNQMKRIKRRAVAFLIALCKIFMPAKYYDSIYLPDFFNSKDLNKLSLREKIWCLKRGFLPYEFIWYDLAHNDFKKYVPARNNYQNRRLNGSFNAILSNKILFEKHIKTVIYGIDKLHTVESIGFIEKGYLMSLQKDIIQGNYSSLLPFLEKNDLVIKPVSGDGGRGVFLIKKKDDIFLLDNKKVDWNELVATLKKLDDYLIQEKIIQQGFANKIYAGSVNSMRIATMIDPVTKQPLIAYAVHRFGSLQSCNIDNISSGGIGAMIDLSDGLLSHGLHFSSDGEKETYYIHPVSLNPICNQKIPDWENLTKRLIEMAGRMPYLKYVGWDIILSDDELLVLEGNVSPHLDLVQMFKPAEEFPAAWNFFKHYKYI